MRPRPDVVYPIVPEDGKGSHCGGEIWSQVNLAFCKDCGHHYSYI